jgi:ubiquinone/menaquinone biosynthesis C-methylase UbiE
VAASFAGAAPEIYDACLGPALFEPYAADLAQRVVERAGDAVLETACGTGVLTRRLRSNLAPAVRLVATDADQPMIDYARIRLRDLGQITWELADCVALPFPAGSFTTLACQFGVMFVPDKPAMLREARRVLADGGLLAFNVWDDPAHNPYARVTQETIARLLPTDPPRFFEVPYGFHDAEAWRSLLRTHDFEVQDLEWITLQAHSPTAERLARGLVRGTPVSNAIKERGGELESFVEAVSEALARIGGEAPFRSTMRALVVTANAR